MREQAFMLGDFEKPKDQILQQLKNTEDFEGNPSYQNALDLAFNQYEICVPAHARKEILIINSSINVSDPRNIFETITLLKYSNTVVSIISLSGKLHVLDKIAINTNGQLSVAVDKAHL